MIKNIQKIIALSLLFAVMVFAAQPAWADSAGNRQFVFAYKLLQQNENKLAADAFDKYLGDFPHGQKRGDALYFRALLYHQAGQDKDALQQLSNMPSPALVPEYAVGLLRGQVLVDLKKYDKAVQVLENLDIKKLKPQVAAPAYYLKAQAYQGAGNLKAAAASFKQAAAGKTSVTAAALLDLGKVQAQLKNAKQAIATLSRATKYKSVSGAAALLAGDLSYSEGHYEKAGAFYSHVVAHHQSSGQFPDAATGLLWSYYSAGDNQKVVETWEHLNKLLTGPGKTVGAYLAGSAQQRLGGAEQKAALLFKQAASGPAPEDKSIQPKALYKLAQCQLKLKKYKALDNTVNQLNSRFPKTPEAGQALFIKASAQASRGHVSASAAVLSKIISKGASDVNYRQALLQRAQLYQANGLLSKAQKDYKNYVLSAKKITPGEHIAWLHWISLAYRQGQYSGAAKAASQLLGQKKLSPEIAQQALYQRALSLIKMSKLKLALAELKKLNKQYPLNHYQARSIYYQGLLLMSIGDNVQAVKLLEQAGADKKLDKALRGNALKLVYAQQRRNHKTSQSVKTLDQLAGIAGLSSLSNDQMLYLADYRLKKDNPKKAVKITSIILQKRSKVTVVEQVHAMYIRGQAYSLLKQYKKADKDLRRAIALGQGFGLKASLALGAVQYRRGAYQSAIQTFDSLVNVGQDKIAARALFEQAQSYIKLAAEHSAASENKAAAKAINQARKDLNRVILLYSVDSMGALPQKARVVLAELELKQGQTKTAYRWLENLAKNYTHSAYGKYAQALLSKDPTRKKALLQKLLASGRADAFLTRRIKQQLKQ